MSDVRTFTLAEPPSLNQMIDLAKQRVKVRGAGGKVTMRPIVYDRHKKAYEVQAWADLRTQGFFPPKEPWARWRIVSVEMRRHNLLDPLEAMASLKFPCDCLVNGRYVAGDGPHQLVSLGTMTQKIDRQNRGITLTIAKVDE